MTSLTPCQTQVRPDKPPGTPVKNILAPISGGQDESVVLKLLGECYLRLTHVTDLVLPVRMVESELVTGIKDELAELCKVLDIDADAVSWSTDVDRSMRHELLLKVYEKLFGEPLASNDQSPSYTPTGDTAVDETDDSPSSSDESQTGHQPKSRLQPLTPVIDSDHFANWSCCGGPCGVGDGSSSSIAMVRHMLAPPLRIPLCSVIAPLQPEEHSTKAALDTLN